MILMLPERLLFIRLHPSLGLSMVTEETSKIEQDNLIVMSFNP